MKRKSRSPRDQRALEVATFAAASNVEMLQLFEADTGVTLKDSLKGVKTRAEATKKSQALMKKFGKWFERVVWPNPEFAEAHRALTEGSAEAVATPGLMDAARDYAAAVPGVN